MTLFSILLPVLGQLTPEFEPIESAEQAIAQRAGCFEVRYQFFDQSVPQSDFTATAKEYIDFEKINDTTFSLQHVSIGQDPEDPKSSPDSVAIHWRELWTTTPAQIFEYDQKRVWKRSDRKLKSGEWSYSIFQIDGSLRFQNIGRWINDKGSLRFHFGRWAFADKAWRFVTSTRAPMPRRETLSGRPESRRYDYMIRHLDALHQPFGYDEINEIEKLRLDPAGDVLVSWEEGKTRYIRLPQEECAKAEALLSKQRPFWNAVNSAWEKIYSENDRIELISGRLIGEFIQMGEKFAAGDRQENLDDHLYSRISQNLKK